mmetsp:Transcript_2104/g.4186  ORF Transcript_2104/g.4186 Transcript_2104/m.4186 type:complete len:249 (-) Transcript_2104:769-1515(-)
MKLSVPTCGRSSAAVRHDGRGGPSAELKEEISGISGGACAGAARFLLFVAIKRFHQLLDGGNSRRGAGSARSVRSLVGLVGEVDRLQQVFHGGHLFASGLGLLRSSLLERPERVGHGLHVVLWWRLHLRCILQRTFLFSLQFPYLKVPGRLHLLQHGGPAPDFVLLAFGHHSSILQLHLRTLLRDHSQSFARGSHKRPQLSAALSNPATEWWQRSCFSWQALCAVIARTNLVVAAHLPDSIKKHNRTG